MYRISLVLIGGRNLLIRIFWEINRIAARIAGYPVQKGDMRAIPLWLVMIFAFLSEWLLWAFTCRNKEPLLTTRVVRLITIERTFCINKIEERLGYRARFTTEEGLERAVGWYMREVYAKEKIQWMGWEFVGDQLSVP